MQLCRGQHPAVSGSVGEPQVLVPLAGTLSLRWGNLEQILRPPTELVFLPAGAVALHTSPFRRCPSGPRAANRCRQAAVAFLKI